METSEWLSRRRGCTVQLRRNTSRAERGFSALCSRGPITSICDVCATSSETCASETRFFARICWSMRCRDDGTRVGNWQSSAARCARSTCTCSIAPVEYRYVHVHVVKIASYYRGGVDVAVTALYCSVQSVDPLYSSLQSDSKVFADNSVATDQERIYLSELCSTCIAITALSRAKAGQWRCTAARETRGQNPCIP